MTAKDFAFIAGVISNLPRENAVRRVTAQEFSDHCRIVNPRFNERTFMDACCVSQLTLPASRIKKGDFIPGWGDVTHVLRLTQFDNSELMEISLKGITDVLVYGLHHPVTIERENGDYR